MAETLLHAAGLTSGYGKVQVLWGVALDVAAQETVVLLGPNGAGKTTLLKVLLGLMPAWQGQVQLGTEDITRLRTDRRVRRGIAYMSELGVFPGLTIEENIRIGGQFASPAALRTRMAELYGVFPDLAERKRALAGSLSGGQRKMLGIAKALAAEPRLLVMDEPSAGLSPLFVEQVIAVLRPIPRRRDGGAVAADRRAERGLPGPGRPGVHAGGRSDRLPRDRRGTARG